MPPSWRCDICINLAIATSPSCAASRYTTWAKARHESYCNAFKVLRTTRKNARFRPNLSFENRPHRSADALIPAEHENQIPACMALGCNLASHDEHLLYSTSCKFRPMRTLLTRIML